LAEIAAALPDALNCAPVLVFVAPGPVVAPGMPLAGGRRVAG
jgi:hypothetical protein